MKNVTDENLNKLIDNELNSSEIDELYSLIKKDEKLLSKAKAHQLVDSILKTIEIENAPANATDLIMQKISNSVMAKERKNGFYKFIISLFGFSILFSLVFALFFMPIKDGQSDSQYYTIKEKVFDFISNLSIPINTDLLAIITATLTIVILISGYFIFEEHKSFKRKLDSIL